MKKIIDAVIKHYGKPIARMDILMTLLTFILGMTIMPLIYHLNIKLPDFSLLGNNFNNVQIGHDIINSFNLFFYNFVVIQFITAIPRQYVMDKFRDKWILLFISSCTIGYLFYMFKEFLFALKVINILGNSNEFIKILLVFNAGFTSGQYVFCLLSFYWIACFLVTKNKCKLVVNES